MQAATFALYEYTFFSNLTEAESENAESRIYLGVRWQSDADEGIVQGKHVADWV